MPGSDPLLMLRAIGVRPRVAVAILLVSVSASARAQQLPPVRPIGPIVARARDSLGSVLGIRPLSDGRLLVNDGVRRRLLLFDASLAGATVVADSSMGTRRAYGRLSGGVIAYRGDSTLFVDPASQSFLVIDPGGRIVRVIAVPDASQMEGFTGRREWGTVGFDARGWLVYGDQPPQLFHGDSSGHDSSAVVRANLETRVIDTVGFIHMDLARAAIPHTDADGYTYAIPAPARLLPATDDWGITADGAIAFVRSRDYHIDWVAPDGARRSTPRMAHLWERLTDSLKTAITDSEVTYLAEHPFMALVRTADSQTVKRTVVLSVVPASELPDYLPPIWYNAVKGDADGNLWIHEGGPPLLEFPGVLPPPRPPIYDVVDRSGRVIDRVEIPGGTTIAGFGPGVAYLTSRDGANVSLVRVRIR